VSIYDINVSTMMLAIVGGQIFSGVLIFAYTIHHERSTALNSFLLSKLMQPIAWILLGLRIYIPGWGIIAAANILLFTGAAFELSAFLMLKENYTPYIKKIYLSLLAGCSVVFFAVTALGFAENIRITVASSILVALLAFPIYRLFTDKHATTLQRIIATVYSFTFLLQIFRAVAAVTTSLDMSLTSSSLVNTWLFVLLYMHMIAGSMGFILLDKEKLDAELIKAATVDGLTDSLNRLTFEKRAAEMISLFIRRQEPVSCLLLDIDDFKKVNDIHGHLMGDKVLRSVAFTIKNQLRNYDLFGRYGGEEFVILLPGVNNQQALDIANRIRVAVKMLFYAGTSGIKCTVSIGVSTILPDMQTTMENFYRLSDKALYLAKDRGKNQVAEA